MKFKKWFFENTILLEITDQIASKMRRIHGQNKLFPFKNIFKNAIPGNENATRFVAPFINDEIGVSLIRKLEEEGFTFDFEKGVLIKDGRPIRMGKYILSKKSPASDEEKQWWVVQGNPIKSLETVKKDDELAIIVSRNPFDIVRMGDFPNILNQGGGLSCHRPDGSYFHCAIADAEHNGGIAYVVKKDDLSKINLDDEEIFKDAKRNVDGIVPISRLRLRRFVNKNDNNEDLAIPEKSLYGKNIPGFYESLRRVIFALQNETINSKPNQRPRLNDYLLKGGEHQDTTASKLFNGFFGDDLDRGTATHEGGGKMAQVWQAECDTIRRRIQRGMDHGDVWFIIEEHEGDPTVVYGGSLDIYIQKERFSKEFMYNIENEDKTNYWIIIEKMKKLLKEIIDEYRGIYVERFELEIEGDLIKLRIGIEDENYEGNPDAFSLFCDNLRDADNDIQKMLKQILYSFSTVSISLPGYKTNIFILQKANYIPKDLQDYEVDPDEQETYKNFILQYHDSSSYDANFMSRYWENVYTMDQNFVDNVKREIEKIYNDLDLAETRFTVHFDESYVKYKLIADSIKSKMLLNFNQVTCQLFPWYEKRHAVVIKIAEIFYRHEANELRTKEEKDKSKNFIKNIENLGFKKLEELLKTMVSGSKSIEPCFAFDFSCLESDSVKKAEVADLASAGRSVLIRTKLYMDSFYHKVELQKLVPYLVEFLDNNYDAILEIQKNEYGPFLHELITKNIASYLERKKEEVKEYIEFLDKSIAGNNVLPSQIANQQHILLSTS